MRRLLSILMLVCFASTGSGLSAELHRAQHALDHQHADHACHHDETGENYEASSPTFTHDDGKVDNDHCQTCLNVRASANSGYQSTEISVAADIIALHSAVTPQCARLPCLLRIETTGPPAC